MDINDICVIDSETRRVRGATVLDVTKSGIYSYSQQAFPVMWQYTIGDGPAKVITLDSFDECLSWDLDVPDEMKRFHDRVEAGRAFYYAWNAAFDLQIWNGPFSDFPEITHYQMRDAMAQAAASGLPGRLSAAAKWLGVSQKLEQGKNLINLFEPSTGGTPQTHPVEWGQYKEYGMQDVIATRDVIEYTRDLNDDEWQQYAVSQIINDRGIAVDTGMCRAAAYLADVSRADTDARVRALTDGRVSAVTKVKDILNFSKDRAARHSALYDIFVKRVELRDDDDAIVRPEALSIERARIEQAVVWLESYLVKSPDDHEMQVLRELLELRMYGGSNTPKKFSKMLAMAHKGRLCGQYVFNGGAQTGRFSSRGVQIHNLVRAALDDEVGAIEFLNDLAAEEGTQDATL